MSSFGGEEIKQALTGHSHSTPESSKHRSKTQRDSLGGHTRSSDSDMEVKTPEQLESRQNTQHVTATNTH